MDVNLGFLNFDGLDDHQVNQIKDFLHPSNLSSEIEFPWSNGETDENIPVTENGSSLNVHAPAFEASKAHIFQQRTENNYAFDYRNSSNYHLSNDSQFYHASVEVENVPKHQINGIKKPDVNFNECVDYSQSSPCVNGDTPQTTQSVPVSSFKLNPTVSCFVPQNIKIYSQKNQDNDTTIDETVPQCKPDIRKQQQSSDLKDNVLSTASHNGEERPHETGDNSELLNLCVKDNVSDVNNVNVQNGDTVTECSKSSVSDKTVTPNTDSPAVNVSTKPVRRSWAQIVSNSSSGQQASSKVPDEKLQVANNSKIKPSDETQNSSIEEDKMALVLGKHLHELELDFRLVFLQPRGLINRRNWCYINATLQALLASSSFYSLIRNLPLGPGVERGKSATPVIDSMVKLTYEFSPVESSQEDLQAGTPFQPDFIYDMLKDLKSDCLKGQQEDAEEFLSFILNGMHEEMVKIIKNFEDKNSIHPVEEEIKENGDLSDNDDEWQVIGSKHKGMVTRKVVEHKTPISDLLGGQIKSLLITSGNKASASIQPFFTLQLDIQSENVNSVSEALKEMTIKEPIQGYTCAKTKQEVEAYSHICLQKLPPVLILHLKRFVYNKNGGCKKVMKKTDYPLELELSKDLFSSDVKKTQRIRTYKLFAVMYHDGEEAIKGHYISDVYSHGCQSWIRCDDRQVTQVTEVQVLSHTPPRVPYLLFYQEAPSSM